MSTHSQKPIGPDSGRQRASLDATGSFQGDTVVSQAAGGGDDLLEAAIVLEREQAALIESAPVYQETLAVYVMAKHEQVERIEVRLENLIEQQEARLQQTQARQPGFLSLPGARRNWQAQQAQQQASIQALHSRLEAVREIKEGTGLHSPRIEELAKRKLRAAEPELVKDWDALREAERLNQAHMRRLAREEKRSRDIGGRGRTLGLRLD